MHLIEEPTALESGTAVTDAVTDAVTAVLIRAEWSRHGVSPLRSVVTVRPLGANGCYDELRLPEEPRVDASG